MGERHDRAAETNVGDTEGGGWSERLRKSWMNSQDYPIIYSLGIRGDGLEKVAKRWHQEWERRGELRRKTPDALLLSIGLNDTAKIGRQDGRPQLTPEAFRYGMERLLREIKSKTKVLVIGLTTVNEIKMTFADCLWYSNLACATYERQIEESCLELDIHFLPIFQAMTYEPCLENMIENDGIHLTPTGHEWLYKRVANWKSLKQWILNQSIL